MATISLLEATSFLREPPKSRPPPPKWNPFFQKLQSQSPLPRIRYHKSIRNFPRSALKPAATGSSSSSISEEGSPFGGIVRTILETLRSLQKPVAAAVLLGFLLTADPYAALAASGGRMGGRSFSSSPAPSRSYSAPSGSRFSYSAPYYAPSPFGGGFYMGPAFGVGFGAGSGFLLLLMGFATVVLLSGFLSDRTDDGSVLTAVQKTTVLKLQVEIYQPGWVVLRSPTPSIGHHRSTVHDYKGSETPFYKRFKDEENKAVVRYDYIKMVLYDFGTGGG